MKICYRCKQPLEEKEMISGLHPDCFCKWFEVDAPDDFRDVAAQFDKESVEEGEWAQVNSSFFHGKFRKYSAHIGSHGYILKVKQDDFPELPLAEYLCNELASAIKNY